MSFNFQWPTFSEAFQNDAASMLTSALNRGPKPKVIADDINVEDINMGTIPPDLEMLEIGELSTDRFRGIFRLTYAGDAHLTLSTKVQANPLTRPTPDSSSSYTFDDASSVFPSSMPSRGILFAARPLVVPMKLRLSSVRLKAIVVLVVSKQKGITLVFKNDPLESVDVSSTFDSVAVIQKYLQQEIEGQLREMFREDLPGIIHRLSQRWLSGKRDAKTGSQIANAAKPSKTKPQLGATTMPEATSSPKQPVSPSVKSTSAAAAKMLTPEKRRTRQKSNRTYNSDTLDTPSTSVKRSSPSRRKRSDKHSTRSSPSSPRLSHRASAIFSSSPQAKVQSTMAKARSTMSASISDCNASTSKQDRPAPWGFSRSWSNNNIDDVEEPYDPTYGLRPDEMRMAVHGNGYSGLVRLANQVNGGLRDLTLEKEEEEAIEVPAPGILAWSANDASSREDEIYADRDEVEVEDDDGSLRQSRPIDEDSDDVPDIPINSSEEDEIDDFEDHGQGSPINSDADEGRQQSRLAAYGLNSKDTSLSETAVEDRLRRSFSASNLDHPTGSPQSKHGVLRTKSMSTSSRAASIASSRKQRRGDKTHGKVEYETIPAVGGGIITRPRIYHSASRVQAPEVEEEDEGEEIKLNGSVAASSTARAASSSRAQTIRPSQSVDMTYNDLPFENELILQDESCSDIGDDSLATLSPEPMDPKSSKYRTQVYRQQFGRTYRSGYQRNASSNSGLSSDVMSRTSLSGARSVTPGWSTSRTSTAPTSTYISNSNNGSPDYTHLSSSPSERKLNQYNVHSSDVSPLRPSTLTNSQSMTLGASHHFMDLVNSNHTLSPYTRTLDTKGFAVRSHPVTPSTGSGGETNSSGGIGGVFAAAASTHNKSYISPTSTSSNKERDYFEKYRSAVEIGGGRRRTFKLGGGVDLAEKAIDNATAKRPMASPLQTVGRQASRRANSASSLRHASSNLSKGDAEHRSSLQMRRKGRALAQSERNVNMSAIRE